MTITSKHIYTIANEEGRFNGKDDHYHGLGAEGVKDLFHAIEEPAIVYVEQMPDGNKPARIVMIVEMANKHGEPVMVAVECAGKTEFNEIYIYANPITTAYGKSESSLTNRIEEAEKDGRLLYANKERSQYLPANAGPNDPNYFEGSPDKSLWQNLPDAIWSLDFTNNIQRFKDAVKRFQPNKKASDKSWRVANESSSGRGSVEVPAAEAPRRIYAEYVARRELADRLADRLEAAEDRSIRSTVQRLRRRRGIDAALDYLAGEVAARRIPSDEATEIYNELTGQEQ